MKLSTRTTIHAWLMVLPACALLAMFTHIPIVTTIWHSFHSTPKPRRPSRFVGLDNYRDMLADPIFWKSLVNNLVYALTSVPISVALALTMALFVNSKLRGKGFLRMAYFTPTVLPMIAVANIWLFFYNPQYGLLAAALKPFGITGINWLGSQDTALWALIAVAIWKEAGFFMIFYLAALQQIPTDLREAAAIEGASRWTYFWRITFPLLMPTTLFVLVNAVINAFRLVDHIFVMTGGGPDNATSVLLFQIYVAGFKFFDQAQAATLSVVLLAILFLIAIGQFMFADKKVHYQ
ncbi:MAG TPA: sugar ABC transporter permease [Beijerinckiaceae bacterium]|nr:sugar ABC transporter permease [Beijerinckiaceae bacterium]